MPEQRMSEIRGQLAVNQSRPVEVSHPLSIRSGRMVPERRTYISLQSSGGTCRTGEPTKESSICICLCNVYKSTFRLHNSAIFVNKLALLYPLHLQTIPLCYLTSDYLQFSKHYIKLIYCNAQGHYGIMVKNL